MSVITALFVIAVAVGLGACCADVASKACYKLVFNAQRGSEKYILRTLGGVIGFASGAVAVQTGNYSAGLYGPPLAVLWMTVVFLALIGVGKLFVSIFR